MAQIQREALLAEFAVSPLYSSTTAEVQLPGHQDSVKAGVLGRVKAMPGHQPLHREAGVRTNSCSHSNKKTCRANSYE